MSSNVSIKVTDNNSGKNVTQNVPVNGRQQTIGAVFASSFPNGKVEASSIEVQKPGEANGVNIVSGPANGPFHQVKSDGTPLKVNTDKPTLDITNWIIAAIKI